VSTTAASGSHTGLRNGMLVSLCVHVALVAAAFWWGARPAPVRPPVYRIELVGQAGLRQVGVDKPTSTTTTAAREAAGAERLKEEKPLPTTSKPVKALPKATATPSVDRTKQAGSKTAPPTTSKNTSAPKSGAGATGTKGAAVANVRTEGIEFPFPGYLSRIVQQIALNWSTKKVSAALVTEVKFFIRRDGSVTGIEVVKSSGDRIYDLDAVGAIEAVGNVRGFGPLPAGWSDDVLLVYFTFDYLLR
jgi:protein TonB